MKNSPLTTSGRGSQTKRGIMPTVLAKQFQKHPAGLLFLRGDTRLVLSRFRRLMPLGKGETLEGNLSHYGIKYCNTAGAQEAWRVYEEAQIIGFAFVPLQQPGSVWMFETHFDGATRTIKSSRTLLSLGQYPVDLTDRWILMEK